MVTYVDNVACTEVRGGWCVNNLELQNGSVTLLKVDQTIGRPVTARGLRNKWRSYQS